MQTDIISEVPEWPFIRERYMRWLDVLLSTVEFQYKVSTIHNTEHCARVLLHTLRLAHACRLNEEDSEALGAASIFHDAGRIADGLDTGHGERSAHYYRDMCREKGFPYDERSYLSMFFHDRPDEMGKEAFLKNGLREDTQIYLIFKDSDGLDRLRLGARYLDLRKLRTPEALGMVGFAGSIAHMTHEELISMLDRPFRGSKI